MIFAAKWDVSVLVKAVYLMRDVTIGRPVLGIAAKTPEDTGEFAKLFPDRGVLAITDGV